MKELTSLTEFRGWKMVSRFPAAGGEADIYLVSRDDQKGILKIFRYGLSPKEEVFARIIRLSQKHPESLVRLIEYGVDPGLECFFEFEEYLTGGNLADHLGRGKLPDEDILALIRQCAAALGVLHDEGILHLDLKPSNVLIRQTDPLLVALSDFGISSVFDAEMSKKLTQAKGTSLYQSPESITGVVIPRSDWWSLGIMVLEVLLGHHPFEGLQNQVILYQLTTLGVEVPESLAPRWKNLVMGLLTRNPDKRWGADQVRKWLSGEAPETFYQQEKKVVQGPGGGAPGKNDDERQFSRPLVFRETEFFSPEELFEAFIGSPANWNDGKALLAKESVPTWLEEGGDPELAAGLRRFQKTEQNPDWALFKSLYFVRPNLPLSWLGLVIDSDSIGVLLQKVGSGTGTTEEVATVDQAISGKILPEYVKLTGRNLGKLETIWKMQLACCGTELETLGVSQKALLFLWATTCAFTGQQAFQALKTVMAGSPGQDRPSSDLLETMVFLVQKKDFPAFAQKTGAWEPGANHVWVLVRHFLENRQALVWEEWEPFFLNGDLVVQQVMKDASFRGLLARLATKPEMDFALSRDLQEFTRIPSWFTVLVQNLYRIPPEVPLGEALASLIMTATLRSRSPEFSTVVLPPRMKRCLEGKIVRSSERKLIREILDNPTILIKKNGFIQTWEDIEHLEGSMIIPFCKELESIEQLQMLKKEIHQILDNSKIIVSAEGLIISFVFWHFIHGRLAGVRNFQIPGSLDGAWLMVLASEVCLGWFVCSLFVHLAEKFPRVRSIMKSITFLHQQESFKDIDSPNLNSFMNRIGFGFLIIDLILCLWTLLVR